MIATAAASTEVEVSRRGRLRVVHVTLAHDPFDVRIFEKQCRTLCDAGYAVHLAVPGAPDGETRSGVRMHAIPLPPPGNAAMRFKRRLAAAFAIARDLRADLYHLHDPELIPVALALKRSGAAVVHDAHEDAPMEAWSLNAHRPLRRVVLPALWWALLATARRKLDLFVAAPPDIARTLPPDCTIEVRNYPRHDVVHERAAGIRRPVLVFAGLLAEPRGALSMLDAMTALPTTCPVRLELFGTFEKGGLEEAMRSHPGWARVDFHGRRPWSDVLAAYSTALGGLVLYAPTPEQRTSLPVKLFECLLAGLPVIATDMPLWRDVSGGSPAVTFVDPNDTTAIAAAIVRLVADPAAAERLGQAGVQLARSRFDWTTEGERLVAAYDRLLISAPTSAGSSS